MEYALGWLRWTPEVFWSATYREFVGAMDGLVVSKGGKSPRTQRETVRHLRELMDIVPKKTVLGR